MTQTKESLLDAGRTLGLQIPVQKPEPTGSRPEGNLMIVTKRAESLVCRARVATPRKALFRAPLQRQTRVSAFLLRGSAQRGGIAYDPR